MYSEMLNDSLNKSIACSLCSNICAKFSFPFIENLDKNELIPINLCGFIMDVFIRISEKDYYQLLKFIEIQDSKNIYAIDIELAPFYCPECDKDYCGKHWVTETTYDEGFYDAEYGICPNGHRKMLFD